MESQKQLVEKALAYLEMIKTSKYYQASAERTLSRIETGSVADFMNLKSWENKRIAIQEAIQIRLQKRVNELLKLAIWE
tara:strand:- start:9845 stop:10081 length:237 start_codon:yes stop_codon:yes gene_type:complete